MSAFTAAAVYDLLVAMGIVEARRGTGYFVAGERPPSHPPGAPEFPVDSLWERRQETKAHSIVVDAGCGWLPADWMPTAAIRAALRARGRAAGFHAGYGSPYGLTSLREQFAIALRGRGLQVQEEQIVTTQGASQALDLVIREFLEPGDLAVVEDPAYPPLLEMLRARTVKLGVVARTAEGPDVQQLAALLRRRRPRMLFTNSVLHNPTGTSTSLAVAQRLVELANRHDFLIVEDDIFSELAARSEASVAALDDCRRVILISSVSKTIAADMRVGYVVASPVLARRLVRIKMLGSLTSSEMMEEIVLNVLVHGNYRRHLETLRRRLAGAQQRVQEILQHRGVELAFRPTSGMFLWARLPSDQNVSKLWSIGAARGVLLAPGELFRPDGRASPYWRFNVAHCDSPPLLEFLEALTRGTRRGL